MANGLSRREVARNNVIPAVMGVIAGRLHIWAGQSDEGHAVWRPGGHLSVIVAFAWLLALLISMSSVLSVGRRAPLAIITAAAAMIALLLLFSV